MLMRRALICVALVASSTTAFAAATENAEYYREQAQTLCFNDVLTLCSNYIPDETQIMACMRARRTQLSSPCRKVFEAGMRQHRQ